ncbi:efflux RND transporter permease subunit [Sulfuriflexus sp.]|uniref:efflux RND transporter permease subunit n=1 Tax=Sulfuriflexus sp. TaxID=2015443 RepID=UPI0028CE2ED8|nr:efflux RND transporter permease subunit [Sulfuriflexus sp.]MDT8403685.1 efflux RND transporter permease subunit [Sulfuriflexus sp.]
MPSRNHNMRFRSGGLASWSIRHPIGIIMITLAVVVLGGFVLDRLSINLLPHIIYPEVRVRIIDPGVPATVMEDRITRQLEEQLAITEDAISVQSRTSEGRSSVDLSFEYGKDIDIALRDASTRLDRAKRFLPTSIDPPVIYKRDPAQIPVMEYVVSSTSMDAVQLRDWVDNTYSKWFLNLPGVAAVEVGGGLVREILILPDQERLSGLGLSISDVVRALQRGNVEAPGGRLIMLEQEIISRTSGRFENVSDIAELPIALANGETIHLSNIARVIDGHEEQRLQVRYNDIPGVKVSIQKQPNANTVNVADAVKQQVEWLKQQAILPQGTRVQIVDDQSIYVRNSLNNAATAAISGAILAMIIVYLFLGNLRHTLIIGSAIPIAIMVTFILMGLGGLSLNIMTLGGLALGIGMLVDNTIVMLENISRHQQERDIVETETTAGLDADSAAAVTAAGEINSAIVASTSTNLAAVLPFLFIGGLIGLLFQELIFTISAAIVASLAVALTLVPALAAHSASNRTSGVRAKIDAFVELLRQRYVAGLEAVLTNHGLRLAVIGVLLTALLISILTVFATNKNIFLPAFDDGKLRVSISADPGISLTEMDASVIKIEKLLRAQPEVRGVFSIVGGRIFGRSEYEASNQSTLTVQLVPTTQRVLSSDAWKDKMQKLIRQQNFAGIRVRMRTYGIRGFRTSRGDDDLSLRIQGPQLATLDEIGDEIMLRLRDTSGLRNLKHSSEEVRQELAIEVDRERAASLGLDIEDVTHALRYALNGEVVTDFIDGDKSYDVRLRLPRSRIESPQDIESILLFSSRQPGASVYLADVANVNIIASPAQVLRDKQQRYVEISASLSTDIRTAGEIHAEIETRLADLALPDGYTFYDGGASQALQEGKQLSGMLLLLALFLVLVVMAIQYESLQNPLIILVSVPFATIGVAIGLFVTGLPVSMPVALGLIMLAGIVVNNAIVLVEYIELQRAAGQALLTATLTAARLRLRPILMTTLTTVVGMLPLALKLGEGAEMLQPLAVTIVSGLSFSLLVSLFLIPVIYTEVHRLLDNRRAARLKP